MTNGRNNLMEAGNDVSAKMYRTGLFEEGIFEQTHEIKGVNILMVL